MAPRPGELQGFAAQAILSHFARGIAAAILKWDRRDDSASLDQLDSVTRAEYIRQGEIVALQSDKDALRLALYAAADELVAGGIGPLTQHHRAAAVAMFTRAFKVMKQQLAGQLHHDRAGVLRAILKLDQANGIDAQPVNAKPSPDLADLETSGVQ